MPQDVKAQPPTNPSDKPSLQGLIATREHEAALIDALEKAFDYRGDVTLTLTTGRCVSGYIFDRKRAATLGESVVRLLPENAAEKVAVRFSEIERVEFTGRDMAHGKTFENWIKRFTEKRLKGESAGIDSEGLD
ncbi:MAG: hypothetical protein IBJ10_09515 [Phycisphaerales bacterium]|nr:hypothetical protein [Phycisphaerales bacterium]